MNPEANEILQNLISKKSDEKDISEEINEEILKENLTNDNSISN